MEFKYSRGQEFTIEGKKETIQARIHNKRTKKINYIMLSGIVIEQSNLDNKKDTKKKSLSFIVEPIKKAVKYVNSKL